jgi:CxxC motif-containing protein (DUF1111 family)
MQRFTSFVALAVLGVLLSPSMIFWQEEARAQGQTRRSGDPRDRGGRDPRGEVLVPGGPLPGLTTEQQAAFADGLEEFEEVEDAQGGLGPVFNGKSCAECHIQPVVGGSSAEIVVAREIRIGTILNGVFDPMEYLGGSVLQQRSIHEELPDSSVTGEQVPPEATLVSRRITTPLFGAGLIETIPVAQILQRADPSDRDRDGISGVPNQVFNPEAGEYQLGRFGWKAHVPTLHLFSGDAYLNEMGITNPSFPQENLPQGQPIPPDSDLVPELEDNGEAVEGFTTFMAFLAPLAPRPSMNSAGQGLRVFQGIGCAGCHTPSLGTGDSPVSALRFKRADLFSDLLLHDMGPGLADGIQMGAAKGSEWRTAPLWGLSRRIFFLHDGRAQTIEAAVASHGGEARRARDRFAVLARRDRDALLAFLNSL